MRLELTGRHVEITPVLRRMVTAKLARLERLLNDSAVSAQVVLTEERRGRRADVTLHARGEKFLHGVAVSPRWQTCVNGAFDKIAQQAKRVKGKWQGRKRQTGRSAPMPDEQPQAVSVRPVRPAPEPAHMPRIVKTSRQSLRPMSLADAARAVDATGDGVVVFRNAETATFSVLYRRADGELTLVETEA